MRLSLELPAVLLALATTADAQLNSLAKRAGKLYFGSATDNGQLSNPAYVKILTDTDEFGLTTPGNAMKWESTEPQRGRFTFAGGDQIAELAKSHGMLLRCHTLLWHNQLADWVSDAFWTREVLVSVIQAHIANVVGHWEGQCYAWDVVNEILNEDGSFRNDIFYRVLGTDYVAVAFRAAAQADSHAKLYYNDYNIEAPGAKQAGAVKVIQMLRGQGVRIDGIGLQGHFSVGSTPSQSQLEGAMNSYIEAGVTEVAYTELDIRHTHMPVDARALSQQGDDFATVTRACLGVKGCIGIETWDFTDRYSWIPSVFPGTGGALLYDKDFNKKPCWTSVRDVLAAAAATAPVNPPPSPPRYTTSPNAPPPAAATTTLITALRTRTSVSPAATSTGGGGGGGGPPPGPTYFPPPGPTNFPPPGTTNLPSGPTNLPPPGPTNFPPPEPTSFSLPGSTNLPPPPPPARTSSSPLSTTAAAAAATATTTNSGPGPTTPPPPPPVIVGPTSTYYPVPVPEPSNIYPVVPEPSNIYPVIPWPPQQATTLSTLTRPPFTMMNATMTNTAGGYPGPTGTGSLPAPPSPPPGMVAKGGECVAHRH